MDRAKTIWLAVSGIAAGILLLAIAVPFILLGESFQFTDFLPIALYQALWCFVEGWVVQKYRPVSMNHGPRDQSGALPLLTGFVAFIIAALAIRKVALAGLPHQEFVIAGYLVGGIGILMRQISIIQLGPLFRDSIGLCEDHRRVSSGLYAFCRHPAEIGFGLAMTGLLFISGSSAGLILFGMILVPLMFIRIILENRLLRERFEL